MNNNNTRVICTRIPEELFNQFTGWCKQMKSNKNRELTKALNLLMKTDTQYEE